MPPHIRRRPRISPSFSIHGRFGWSSYFGAIFFIVLLFSWFYGQRLIDSYAAGYGIDRASVGVFDIDTFTGPLIENIAEHGDYRACYNSTQGIDVTMLGLCMSAARMPVIPLFGALVSFVSKSLLFYVFAKNILVFGMATLAIWMVARRQPVNSGLFLAVNAFLFLNPINLTVASLPATEESVLFGLQALLMAVLLSNTRRLRGGTSSRLYLGIGVLSALLPMTKSTGIAAASALSLVWLLFARRRRFAPLLPLFIVGVTLVGWGAFIEHKTGHFAFGGSLSSINSLNLYKGNNPETLRVYPTNHVDEAAVELERPLTGEWDYFRYFEHRAFAYMREHPAATVWGAVVKLYVALFKVTPELWASNPTWTKPWDIRYWVNTIGIALDRILLWAALATSGVVIWRRYRMASLGGLLTDDASFGSLLYLLIVVTWILPYLVGFVLYRHIVPLYFVSGVYLLWQHAQASLSSASPPVHAPTGASQ